MKPHNIAAAVCVHSVAQLCPTLQSCQVPPWDSPGKNMAVSFHVLLQGIFLTLGLNLHLLNWQADSLSLNHLGSPRLWEQTIFKRLQDWSHEVEPHVEVPPIARAGFSTGSLTPVPTLFARKQDYIFSPTF